jgi:glycosidase
VEQQRRHFSRFYHLFSICSYPAPPKGPIPGGDCSPVDSAHKLPAMLIHRNKSNSAIGHELEPAAAVLAATNSPTGCLRWKRACFVIAVAGFSASTGLTAPPRVSRVEPPNWWVGHSHNPVRLLISGENLSGARVEAPPGFQVGPAQSSENGAWLFVDLHIPDNCRPGEVPLRVVGKTGEDRLSFPLLARQPREGKVQGISPDDVIYLLMLDRFANGDLSNDNPAVSPGLHDRKRPRRYHGGDFQGVIDRLGYLRQLGVTTLWLTPWYDNANHLNQIQMFDRDEGNPATREPSADYHGYGVVDFYGTEEHFGDLQLLQKLVERAHTSGLKVIQDQVVNLTSPYHPWVTNPPTRTWFNGSVANHLTNTFQTWTITVTNPPADQLKATLEGWFFGFLPDLNQNDPEVAAYLIQNSLWWVGMTGVDAVRQDALPYVPRAYWSRWAAALKREHPRLTILGEMWDNDPKHVAFFQGGRRRFDGVDSGVDTLFDFPLHYAMREVFANRAPMTRLTETLAADTNYVAAEPLVTFLGLHDQPRFLNEPGATIDRLKLAFTFLLTTRGTPLIYYGDEIAMRGEFDPYNRQDFPGGWPEDARNAFEASRRTAEEAAIHDHISKLLRLRKELRALRRGKMLNLFANSDTYAFARVADEDWAIVVFNNSPRRQHIEVPLAGLKLDGRRSLTNRLDGAGTPSSAEGKLRMTMLPRTAALLTP